MNLVLDEDMFRAEYGKADLVFFSANSTLDRDDRLVMGAGAALQAKRLCPSLPALFGKAIRDQRAEGGRYGIIVLPSRRWDDAERGRYAWGAFQVKTDWREPAKKPLIAIAARDLAELAWRLPLWRFALNFPRVGAGGLSVDDVMPLVERLPDNVWVYRRDS